MISRKVNDEQNVKHKKWQTKLNDQQKVSLMKILKSKDPAIKPCKTLARILLYSLKELPILLQ